MYDYSGEWMSTVDLPVSGVIERVELYISAHQTYLLFCRMQAKSGVSGIIYVVVPHIMGIAVFSPPLDSHGNSVRGVEFCKRLLREFKYGVFDQMVSGDVSAAAQGRAVNIAGISRPPGQLQPQHSMRNKGGLTGRTGDAPKDSAVGRSHAALPGSPHLQHAVSPPGFSSSSPSDNRDSRTTTSDPGSMASGSTTARGTTASGQRIEKARRIGIALRRLSRSWMLLRAWSGLPVFPGDLAKLQVRKRDEKLVVVCVCLCVCVCVCGGGGGGGLCVMMLSCSGYLPHCTQAIAVGDADAPAELCGAPSTFKRASPPSPSPDRRNSDSGIDFSGTVFRLAPLQGKSCQDFPTLEEKDEDEDLSDEDDEELRYCKFPSCYARYKRYRDAVAQALVDGGDGKNKQAGLTLSEAVGTAESSGNDNPDLIDAMRDELDYSRHLVPIVALRLFLERAGLSISSKAHPDAALQVCSCANQLDPT
jgi:hypothetical protein